MNKKESEEDMGKYFGTDGVRGIANRDLTAEMAYKIGRCGGYILTHQSAKPKVVIGQDTRISGPMLEAALVAGLLSIGADVIRLGVITTPGVAYLTRALNADAGVMISASHNPVEDNGIKFFGSDGFKLFDETELAIERLLDEAEDRLPRPVGAEMGKVASDEQAKFRYADYLLKTVDTSFHGMKIVLDCAHGAAYELAPYIFSKLGAEVVTIGTEPNGLNINDGCGSTHPEYLQQEVLRHQADVGLAFDGDADRMIAVDDKGEVVDGDYILCISGEAMKRAGKLQKDTIVTTVMSNLGFDKALREHGMKSVKTAVGDRYVVEEMLKNGYNLGGEQSGHVIFLDYNTTGDGMLTGLQLVSTIKKSGQPLSSLKQIMTKYPQVLLNVPVEDKSKLDSNANIGQTIRDVENELGGNGRVLVRPSGTEALIRVMVEGPDKRQIEQYAERIADVIRREL
jgi:phosphoglucosamine mutase